MTATRFILALAAIGAAQDAAPLSRARTASAPAEKPWSRWCEKPCSIDPTSEKDEAAEIAKANERLGRVEKELATIGDHPWAGVYDCGGGADYGVRIHVAPHGGFVFTGDGCTGLYGFNHGDVVEVGPGHLRGTLARPIPRRPADTPPLPGEGGLGDDYVDGDFYFFEWRGHRYLVPGKEMIGLCNAVNAGDDAAFAPGPCPWFPRFALRPSVVASAPADARPLIPAEFAAYLLARPVRARVVSDDVSPRTVGDRAAGTETTIDEHLIRLDAGGDQGLRRGMHLHRRVANPSDRLVTLAVDDVGATSCIVRAREWRSVDAKPSPPLAVGTELSTRRDDRG
ncbi:MAG TPA: hypothetical protein VKE69_02995 [Planctomycetota bacterium]|nr:hypothetical protein [Planctomycetota bacterium]